MIDKLLSNLKDVRYVAVYRDGKLNSKVKSDIKSASSSDSDVYEELLVNPTILKLTSQRGEIDCGGLEYVIIRYGNFFQLVIPKNWGHISVCLESDCNLNQTVAEILDLVSNE